MAPRSSSRKAVGVFIGQVDMEMEDSEALRGAKAHENWRGAAHHHGRWPSAKGRPHEPLLQAHVRDRLPPEPRK